MTAIQGEASRYAAARIRQERENQGLSLAAVADGATALGHQVEPRSLAWMEDGLRRVTVDDLVAIAWALGVPYSDLLPPDVVQSRSDPKGPS